MMLTHFSKMGYSRVYGFGFTVLGLGGVRFAMKERKGILEPAPGFTCKPQLPTTLWELYMLIRW